jgi:choline monooxygenase
MPGRYYFDPAIYEREKSRIFHRTWQYAGHESMLVGSGSYLVRQIMDQSVVIVRGTDGSLRAFHNVCQHRAHRLLEGEGRLASALITCPYHAWTYDLKGQLRQARGTERVTGFRKEAVCLTGVRLASRLGFLFVNLEPAAPDFDELAGPMFDEVEGFSPRAAQLKIAHRSEISLEANWKNSVENFSECFHCPISHPTLVANALDYPSYRITTHAHHHSHRSRDRGPEQGYGTQTEGAAKPNEFGSWLLWPNWCIEVYPGGNLTVFHHVPVAPERTVQVCEWYFPSATLTVEQQEIIDFVDVVRREDVPICESVQQGLHSLGYAGGHFVIDAEGSEVSEHAVADFQAKVLRALGEESRP